MKTKAICPFFVLFAIVAGIGATTPAAFAEVTIVPAADSGVPGCEETSEGCYIPGTVTVGVGKVVIMSNTDSMIHTFTAGTPGDGPSGEFDTILMADETFEYTADTAGKIPYYCSVHLWMQGVIIVEAEEAMADEEIVIPIEAEAEEAMMDEEIVIPIEAEAEEAMADEEIVIPIEAEAEEAMMDEEIVISIEAEPAAAGETTDVTVTITNMDGSSTEHVNYDVMATQGGETVLDEKGVHDHDGMMTHTTMALPLDASSDMPVDVSVTFNGFGIDPPFTGPIGEASTMQVVPEFGTIAMMVLAVAIISIVAVTTKSRIIPRF